MKKKTTYDLRTERMDYIFDTHAHYDDEAFDADREEVLKIGRASCRERV